MASNGLYKSPKERYEDTRSSAFSLIAIGGIGLVVMILDFAGVIHLPLHNFALFTMTALFVIFLIVGVGSLGSAKKILATADKEAAKIAEIKNWYLNDSAPNAALEALEERFTDDTEEEKELQRYETIRALLDGEFPDVSEVLLDTLASEFSEKL